MIPLTALLLGGCNSKEAFTAKLQELQMSNHVWTNADTQALVDNFDPEENISSYVTIRTVLKGHGLNDVLQTLDTRYVDFAGDYLLSYDSDSGNDELENVTKAIKNIYEDITGGGQQVAAGLVHIMDAYSHDDAAFNTAINTLHQLEPDLDIIDETKNDLAQMIKDEKDLEKKVGLVRVFVEARPTSEMVEATLIPLLDSSQPEEIRNATIDALSDYPQSAPALVSALTSASRKDQASDTLVRMHKNRFPMAAITLMTTRMEQVRGESEKNDYQLQAIRDTLVKMDLGDKEKKIAYLQKTKTEKPKLGNKIDTLLNFLNQQS